jgi:Electron transfer DM13
MKRRIWIIPFAVLAGIGWYAFRPELLFLDKRVNEALPAEAAAEERPAAPAASIKAGETDVAAPVLSGQFHSVAHETKGTATVHQLADGRRFLRLTDFETSNGPDLRVYLVAVPNATDDETVEKADYVELGRLKGNQGDQNYDVPSNLDLTRYRAATIWCKRFSVNFGTAPLTPAS